MPSLLPVMKERDAVCSQCLLDLCAREIEGKGEGYGGMKAGREARNTRVKNGGNVMHLRLKKPFLFFALRDLTHSEDFSYCHSSDHSLISITSLSRTMKSLQFYQFHGCWQKALGSETKDFITHSAAR